MKNEIVWDLWQRINLSQLVKQLMYRLTNIWINFLSIVELIAMQMKAVQNDQGDSRGYHHMPTAYCLFSQSISCVAIHIERHPRSVWQIEQAHSSILQKQKDYAWLLFSDIYKLGNKSEHSNKWYLSSNKVNLILN